MLCHSGDKLQAGETATLGLPGHEVFQLCEFRVASTMQVLEAFTKAVDKASKQTWLKTKENNRRKKPGPCHLLNNLPRCFSTKVAKKEVLLIFKYQQYFVLTIVNHDNEIRSWEELVIQL